MHDRPILANNIARLPSVEAVKHEWVEVISQWKLWIRAGWHHCCYWAVEMYNTLTFIMTTWRQLALAVISGKLKRSGPENRVQL